MLIERPVLKMAGGLPTRVVRVIKMVAVILTAITLLWLLEDGSGLVHTGLTSPSKTYVCLLWHHSCG